MTNTWIRKIVPHLLVFIGFCVLSLMYFSPVLKGKEIYQNDIVQYIGMAKQHNDYHSINGKETYWTNSAFGGMPTYQLGAKYPHNYIKKLDLALRFLPRPADYLFLYLMGFYILMLVLKVDYRLATLGSIAFGLSTYLIIILGVGHNAKAHAVAYMPLVISGILLCFQKKYKWGFLLTALAMGLELVANHFQMTYYLMLLVIVIGLVYFYYFLKQKELIHYFKSIGVLTAAVALAIGMNATTLMATKQYATESTRSSSELTINADGTERSNNSALDYDYITEYSYGFLESFNLMIPRFMGGGNREKLDQSSSTYKAFIKLGATPVQALQQAQQAPMYWGKQPIVEAPAYIGVVVVFLFIFALYSYKGVMKQWLIIGFLLSLLLSYGKNLSILTDLFIYYFPMYDKFRAVTSIQVILELCVPIMAILGLQDFLFKQRDKAVYVKALKNTTLTTVGLMLTLLIIGTYFFNFNGLNDAFFESNYGADFIKLIKEDRLLIFQQDTLRSLAFSILTAISFWFFINNKTKLNYFVGILILLIGVDLIGINKRYVNSEDFVHTLVMKKPFTATDIDREILKDSTHFRVYDLTTNTTKPSYFFNSINGYHAAKLRRFNELMQFYIYRNKFSVLNMLNTKYIIYAENGKSELFKNPDALGNAWFIKSLIGLNSADAEILALDTLDVGTNAVARAKKPYFKAFNLAQSADISLKSYSPNSITYSSNNPSDGFAVFSEIYYPFGWQAYIDGKAVEQINVNYVLRGLHVPKGKHDIKFEFLPIVVKKYSTVSLFSTLAFFIIISSLFLIKIKIFIK